MKAGPKNQITDIAGLRVGNTSDAVLRSGVTALVCDVANTASVHTMGGAPGTRETDLLAPENIIQGVNAFILSGGSSFGLDAASGAQALFRKNKIGFEAHGHHIPIVPAAILFDLVNGGDKDWGDINPYQKLGAEAVECAATNFELGSTGAGTGALVGGPGMGLKGGLGSASTVLANGVTVGALVAVNAMGAATMGESEHFWAAPFELDDEFGGLGMADLPSSECHRVRLKYQDRQAEGTQTTVAVIATDAKLDKGQCKRLAIAAHDGFARALWPVHTPLDGDLIFSLATGGSEVVPGLLEQIELSAVAASTMSRAIARAIYCATTTDGDLLPSWAKAFNRD